VRSGEVFIMNTKWLGMIVVAVAMLVGGAAAVRAAEPPKEDAVMWAKLIRAIEKSDYNAFIADGDAAFKQMKKEVFESAAAQLVLRLKAGYDVSYLGDARQRGYHLTIWKISFKDGGDDVIANLGMKDGKVGGFFFR
jgi:hypothetical protein